MATMLSTAGLARGSARRPWLVIGGWLVIMALAVGFATGLGDALTTDANFLSRPESVRGDELIDQRAHALEQQAGTAVDPSVSETLLFTSPNFTVDQPEFQAAVERATADLRADPNVVAEVVNYYEAKAGGSPLADQMVAADRHTTLLPVELKGDYDTAEANLGAYLALVQQQTANGFEAFTVGELSVDEEFNAISESDLQKEVFSLPITLVVLVVVFGALVAAGIRLRSRSSQSSSPSG